MRSPLRTSRMAPGAPAATSASTSFCSPAVSVSVAVLGVAIADAVITAAAAKRESVAPQTTCFGFLPGPGVSPSRIPAAYVHPGVFGFGRGVRLWDGLGGPREGLCGVAQWVAPQWSTNWRNEAAKRSGSTRCTKCPSPVHSSSRTSGRRENRSRSPSVVGRPNTARQGTSRCGRTLRIDPRLELGRVRPQHCFPVTEDDLLLYVMGGGHERAHLLGDPFQAKAVLERQPDLGEAGTAKRRLESVGELRERPNLGAVVDKDDAAGRIGHGVDAGEAGHHRVPDYDRPLNAQPDEQLVDLNGDLVERARCPATLAVRRQVDRNAAHRAAQALHDRAARCGGRRSSHAGRRPGPRSLRVVCKP